MNPAAPFIARPVATTLLTIAVGLAGIVAFQLLPVAPLPQVDFPTIAVSAALPGASPETMASAVATPLERQFGRIAGVSEMTSSSSLGTTNVILQFSLDRNIDAAARDVQAAIAAARGNLPANLPSNPSYRKVNPADSPIFILAMTSRVLSTGQMYDAASTILAQKLAQISGVGQVNVGGSTLPAVRVELNPAALNKYGIGTAQVRQMLNTANSNLPKGHLAAGNRTYEIGATDQLFGADKYGPLLVTYRNGNPVRLADVARVEDSVENVRAAGYTNASRSVMLIVFRQPGANIIATVDRIRASLPQLQASIPQSITLQVAMDQTTTIRASIHDVEITLVLSVVLVILVVFLFLRDVRSTLIPSVAVPVSLIGTFGVMYALGYSLDNLSLMALTISTGFVVDDAIVVVENVARYLEQGMRPREAALKGAEEIGFTVVTITLSLVAVFIPLLLMGGVVGRLFHEFAVTLSVAILVSMVISLTTTPMMCAYLLRPPTGEHGRLYRWSERGFEAVVNGYARTLRGVLRHPLITLLVLLATIGLNVYLFVRVPKGFFPLQDNGRMMGMIQADQDTSFETMNGLLQQVVKIVSSDPGVEVVNAFTGGGGPGGGGSSTGQMFITLKPLAERKTSAMAIITRLRPQLARVAGASIFLQPAQDLRVGGRSSGAQFQFTMSGDNLDDLTRVAPVMLEALRKVPELTDVNSDQQNRGLEARVTYDRATASRMGISTQTIDDTLYDLFGQRQVSTMFAARNQYRVVMEAAPEYARSPAVLKEIFVRSANNQAVPLSAFSRFEQRTAPVSVNHQGLFPAATLSFNLVPGVALGDAVTAIDQAAAEAALPATVRYSFAGTAQEYQRSLANQPLLIAAALASVYIVLGILYESYIHPITILSTLPSAGVGALLALLLFDTELSIIAVIGIILLIGIVKKNAILMIDFAIAAERDEGKNSFDSIYEACRLRFRPILMTTLAALLGAVPLAFGTGTGSELRRPLGIAIIGGLIVSQILTLYTTPVVYLYLDRLQRWWQGGHGAVARPAAGEVR